jgi:hypothetical protein
MMEFNSGGNNKPKREDTGVAWSGMEDTGAAWSGMERYGRIESNNGNNANDQPNDGAV